MLSRCCPLAVLLVAMIVPADDVWADDSPSSADDIRSAIAQSISLVEKSAAEYRRQRECFSCHHQALPVLALSEARGRGFLIDEENFHAQLKHTADHLERGRESYLKGKGQGGRADTAGWALWTLELGQRGPDERTAAVAEFLLTYQSDSSHWSATSQRPPTEASAFTTTYVALRGLSIFATAEQAERAGQREKKALEWLLSAEAKDTEDRVFRLRTLHYLGAEKESISAASGELLSAQLEDGSWAQISGGAGDAYATGTALAALHDAGGLSAEDPAYRRGVDFLMRTRQPDGSWKVSTRSKPIQIYFESGFPHAEDQFISISATCWAMYALLLTCPVQ